MWKTNLQAKLFIWDIFELSFWLQRSLAFIITVTSTMAASKATHIYYKMSGLVYRKFIISYVNASATGHLWVFSGATRLVIINVNNDNSNVDKYRVLTVERQAHTHASRFPCALEFLRERYGHDMATCPGYITILVCRLPISRGIPQYQSLLLKKGVPTDMLAPCSSAPSMHSNSL